MPEVVELYVVMHCEACAASVKRAVIKIPGVHSLKIDYYGQKVTVTGNVDRENVWRHIRKTGKRVALISKPEPPKEEPKKTEKKEENEEVRKEDERGIDNKVEEKEAPVDEKDQEKTEETEETNVVERKEATIMVRKKSMYWPAVKLWRLLIPREVKVHEKEKITVVGSQEEEKVEKEEFQEEEKKEGEEKSEGQEEAKSEGQTEAEKPKEPEWVPMLVSAPFYTLPSRIY